MDAAQPITAADGTPLKKKLAQAMFRSKLRATGLVVPLLAFVMASFFNLWFNCRISSLE